jgi:hypothetical protein
MGENGTEMHVSAQHQNFRPGLCDCKCTEPAGCESLSVAASQQVDVDCGQLVYPSLQDVLVVVDLHEFSPVGGRPTSGRHRRRFRFTQAMPSCPSPACEPPVRREPAPAGRLPSGSVMNEMSRTSPPHAGHWRVNSSPTRAISFRPRDPGIVVGGTGSGCGAVGACPFCYA